MLIQQDLPDNVVVERIVEVSTPADSSWLIAMLECDSALNVVLREFSSGSDNQITDIKISLDTSGMFKADIYKPPDMINLKSKDSIIYKPVYRNVPNEYMSNTDAFFCVLGQIFLAMISGILIYKLIKRSLKWTKK